MEEQQKTIKETLNDLNLHINKILESADIEREALNSVYTELEENLNIAQRSINGYTEISEIKRDAIHTLSRLKDQIDPTYNSYISQFGHFLEDVSKINAILKQKDDIEKFAQVHAKSLENRGKENHARETLFNKVGKLQKNLYELEFTQGTLKKIQTLLQQKFAEFTSDIKKLQTIAANRMNELHVDWSELKKIERCERDENYIDDNALDIKLNSDKKIDTTEDVIQDEMIDNSPNYVKNYAKKLYEIMRDKIKNLINYNT